MLCIFSFPRPEPLVPNLSLWLCRWASLCNMQYAFFFLFFFLLHARNSALFLPAGRRKCLARFLERLSEKKGEKQNYLAKHIEREQE